MKTATHFAAEITAQKRTPDQHMAHLKQRAMRLKSLAKKPAALAQKLEAQRRCEMAEAELHQFRRCIFDVEDLIAGKTPPSQTSQTT